MHLFLDSFIFDKITHNNPIRKMNHLFQIHSVCTCARNMYILALAGCAPKETCEIALKMRECCQQSCKLCCKMTKMMAFNLDDYFPLCPFHVPSGIPVEFLVRPKISYQLLATYQRHFFSQHGSASSYL